MTGPNDRAKNGTKNGISVGVVGATGVVGETFLQLLEEREFPLADLHLFASENSEGIRLNCQDRSFPVQSLSAGCFDGLDLVFFSSGDDISREWAPKAVQAGAFAVDNSAAFRGSTEHILAVPEVNGDLLPRKSLGAKASLIANPNCSTIQLVVALSPLAKAFGLSSVRVASYQSVSGAGRAGLEELLSTTRLALEGEEINKSSTFPAPVAFNCIPQIGSFDGNGFCTEEVKIMTETRKILRLPKLPVSAFTVRVPTLNAHAEAVWVTLNKSGLSQKDLENAYANHPGIEISAGYATQKSASGQDAVYIGRIRPDLDDPHTWLMWIVSDNLRKGAALNGLQIAEHIFDID